MEQGGRQTIRQEIMDLLERSPSTLRDISQVIGIMEKDVPHHLEFIDKTLKQRKKRIQVEPYHCLACGFRFSKRQSFKKPGKCPQCKETRVVPAVFWIEPQGDGKSR